MRAISVFLRCLLGSLLGAAPGVSLLSLGVREPAIGVAFIGGVFGLLLALSGVLYRTSARETLRRSFLLFLQLMVVKNIPGGEALVPIPEKDIVPATAWEPADPVALNRWMSAGAKCGVLCALVPAILMAIYLPAGPKPEPLVLDVMKRVVIVIASVLLVGGSCGAALGALFVHGVHRRNILLGTILGLLVGTAIAIAITPFGAWQTYAFFWLAFAWLGMGCGLASGDNFRSRGEELE